MKPIETDRGTAPMLKETYFSVKDSIGAKVGYMFESSLVKLIYTTVSLAQGCRFSKSIALTTSSSELIPPAIKQ